MPEVTPQTAIFMLDLSAVDGMTAEEINNTFDFFTAEEEDLFAVLQTTLCPD